MENPNYDWAYAIIRNYAYEAFKKIRLDSLELSTYAPLSETAKKIKREQFYHLYHWEVWIDQLSHSTPEAQRRLNQAIRKTWEDLASLFDLGPKANSIVKLGLLESSEQLKQRFLKDMQEKLQGAGLVWPGEPLSMDKTGREGSHSPEFTDALEHLSEVYKLAPQANW